MGSIDFDSGLSLQARINVLLARGVVLRFSRLFVRLPPLQLLTYTIFVARGNEPQYSRSPLRPFKSHEDDGEGHHADHDRDDDYDERGHHSGHSSRALSRASLYTDDVELPVPMGNLDAPGDGRPGKHAARDGAGEQDRTRQGGQADASSSAVGVDSKRGVLLPTDRQANLEQRDRASGTMRLPEAEADAQGDRASKMGVRRKMSSSSEISSEMELENHFQRVFHDLESQVCGVGWAGRRARRGWKCPFFYFHILGARQGSPHFSFFFAFPPWRILIGNAFAFSCGIQIEMLHTELNFERYLKEQHIQRIRRLRRENIKIQAFQIEHTSMVYACGFHISYTNMF